MLEPVQLAQPQIASRMTCPESGVTGDLACGMRVTTTAYASCGTVLAEMRARVNAPADVWEDPHNNGTYTEGTFGETFLTTSRITGDGKYTDKQNFQLTETEGGVSCLIEACSRSLVTSLYDEGTNYCNLKMLYCGSGDGCSPVNADGDFTVAPEQTEAFKNSNADLNDCFGTIWKDRHRVPGGLR